MGADSALSLHSMRNFDPATVLQHNRRAHSSLSGGGTVGGGTVGGGVGGGGGRLLNSVAGLGSIPPRSWHPSPLASDEENMSNLSAHSAASLGGEPAFYKEEKKNKIKMEIARRRQQIEENACLHEELTRLARLRENAEYGSSATAAATARLGNSLGGNPLGGLMNAGLAGTQPSALAGAAAGGTGVLKSVDEILRDPFAPASSAAARTTAGLGLTSALPAGGAGAAAGLYGASAGMGGLSSAADLLAARTTANSVGISAADPLLTGGVGVNSALLNSTADMSDLAHARRLTASAAGHMASAAGSLGLASNPAAASLGGVGGVGGLVNSDPYSRSAAISAGVYR